MENKEKLESFHGYTVGETVYVKPSDWNVLKCVITGFQIVDNRLPIVECDHPYKKGEKFKNAINLDRISRTPIIKLYEWGLVEKTYTYEK